MTDHEEKYAGLRGLLANAMFSDNTSEALQMEILSQWQNRMRSAASLADGMIADPPAFGRTVSPEDLRTDTPMWEIDANTYVNGSSRLTYGRADMAQGQYICVPKVVKE